MEALIFVTLDQAMVSQICHQKLKQPKKNKLDFIKMKSFCASKETIKKVKRHTTEQKNIFANHLSDKSLVFRTYKQLLQLNTNNNKNNLKMDKGSEQTILQRRYTFQHTNEKMINIISHQGNANQNHNEIPFRTHQVITHLVIIKKTNNNKCWQRCEETGTLTHCWQKCKMVQPLQKIRWQFLKKLYIELLHNSAISPLGIDPREMKTCPHKNLYTDIHSRIVKKWKQPKNPSTEECTNKILFIYIMEYYSAIKRNKELRNATTWMNLENMLSERIKTTYCMTPFT